VTRRAAAASVALVIALAACTADPDADGSGGGRSVPSYEEAACPSDVSGVILADLTCGYLTTLEDRDRPDGRTVRVFVARITPAGEIPPDPYLLLGSDLADQTNFGGFAPTAERVGRELIMIEPRGIGHSVPSLACPEVDDLSVAVLEVPMDDTDARASFLDAVGACYERITAEGVDPSLYSIDAMAADAVDLRHTLGIEEWNVASHGTTSRIAFEIAGLDPEGVRALFLDTPDVPTVDPLIESVEATRAALDALGRACADDRRCAARVGDLVTTIEETVERLDTSPATVTVAVEDVPAAAGATEPVDVVVDDLRFLAMLRQILSDGASSGESYDPKTLPATVAAARRGEFDSDVGSVVSNMMDDQPYCTGFLPKCTPLHRSSYGALLSYVCRDVVPFVDADAVTAGDPAMAAAFVLGPFWDACEVWRVEPGTGDPADVPTGIPALVELGLLDPYGHPDVVGEALSALEPATIIEVPTMSHNVSPVSCLIELRRIWIDDPSAPVTGGECAAEEVPLEFVFGSSRTAAGSTGR
jgi:pimeloyl-ACP methyl ester carboxylesterase